MQNGDSCVDLGERGKKSLESPRSAKKTGKNGLSKVGAWGGYLRGSNSQEITLIRFRLSGVPISRLFAGLFIKSLVTKPISCLLGFGEEGCPSHASSISWLFKTR